jgi:AraC-like DNA-binding protein
MHSNHIFGIAFQAAEHPFAAIVLELFKAVRACYAAVSAALMIARGTSGPIAKAIGRLREKFDQILSMEELAHELGMSVSGFHHQFKSVTAMSPLQFQKQIRLQEARSMMLTEDLDAASAGFRVGYEDPAYFSRDYKKLFGAPPQRDIAQIRSGLEL